MWGEREILIHDLDPRVVGVLRPMKDRGQTIDQDRAFVGTVNSGRLMFRCLPARSGGMRRSRAASTS